MANFKQQSFSAVPGSGDIRAVPYGGMAGQLNYDQTILAVDITNQRLGIGTDVMTHTLEVAGTIRASNIIDAGSYQVSGGGTSGEFLQGNGVSFSNSNYTLPTALTQGQLFYASTDFVVSQVQPQHANQLLTTNGSNVPTWSSDLNTSITIGGDYIYRVSGTDVSLADGGTGSSLSDPNADRILFWDDSAGSVTWLTANRGLSISGTELNVDGVVEEVDTMNDLLAITPSDNRLIRTRGYHAVNDGGGGLYRGASVATGTNDGGTNIPKGMGKWVLVHEGVVSVKQFGAVGDGVKASIASKMPSNANVWTSHFGISTTARASFAEHWSDSDDWDGWCIQRAINGATNEANRAGQYTKGYKVYIPPGIYRTSRPLTIGHYQQDGSDDPQDYLSGVTVEGAGSIVMNDMTSSIIQPSTDFSNRFRLVQHGTVTSGNYTLTLTHPGGNKVTASIAYNSDANAIISALNTAGITASLAPNTNGTDVLSTSTIEFDLSATIDGHTSYAHKLKIDEFVGGGGGIGCYVAGAVLNFARSANRDIRFVGVGVGDTEEIVSSKAISKSSYGYAITDSNLSHYTFENCAALNCGSGVVIHEGSIDGPSNEYHGFRDMYLDVLHEGVYVQAATAGALSFDGGFIQIKDDYDEASIFRLANNGGAQTITFNNTQASVIGVNTTLETNIVRTDGYFYGNISFIGGAFQHFTTAVSVSEGSGLGEYGHITFIGSDIDSRANDANNLPFIDIRDDSFGNGQLYISFSGCKIDCGISNETTYISVNGRNYVNFSNCSIISDRGFRINPGKGVVRFEECRKITTGYKATRYNATYSASGNTSGAGIHEVVGLGPISVGAQENLLSNDRLTETTPGTIDNWTQGTSERFAYGTGTLGVDASVDIRHYGEGGDADFHPAESSVYLSLKANAYIERTFSISGGVSVYEALVQRDNSTTGRFAFELLNSSDDTILDRVELDLNRQSGIQKVHLKGYNASLGTKIRIHNREYTERFIQILRHHAYGGEVAKSFVLGDGSLINGDHTLFAQVDNLRVEGVTQIGKFADDVIETSEHDSTRVGEIYFNEALDEARIKKSAGWETLGGGGGSGTVGISSVETFTGSGNVVPAAATNIVHCNSASTITVELPNGDEGKNYTVKRVGIGSVGIHSTDAIDGDVYTSGSPLYIPTQYSAVTVYRNGSGWFIV